MEFTMTNRRQPCNNTPSARATVVKLDFEQWRGILNPLLNTFWWKWWQKEEEEKRAMMKWKNENTNLLIVTSAACSGETAGYQTLKGTGAEFNASCQGNLMWLSPPARDGIVKLSAGGKDAQTALRDAVPSPGTSLRTQQGVGMGKHPPSSPRSLYVFVTVCACAHVWIQILLKLFFCGSPSAMWCYRSM